ncbi:mitochondrial glycoprotein [Mycotypha africana]|uniref:mitochondrial glycoprotein n=1 Tax=Mycotypha africana TaxID=64632 RepID=UPI002301C094|nr:mitochondrial glycoprotein [Mycotypha africana]KAI8991137.1 mitochondrial glycoprotein [Mycotypha africana]
MSFFPTVDPDLAHLLQEELNFAKAEKEETPAFIQEFLDTHLFQIEDTEGDDKVTLRRQFGNEKISVLFSISDINHPVEEEEEVEADMDIPEHSHPPRSQENASFPVRATVMIEKEHKGSLVLTTVAQDGYIEIDSVRYFKEGDLKKEDLIKAEMDAPWKQDRYAGPVFEELEDELQATFSRYLEERGIDTALATFLPDYIDYKEQKEYVSWLNNVNDFVSS